MSRGFVKEDDLERAGTDVPERPISEHVNYVTPAGLQQIQQAIKQLDTERLLLADHKEEPSAQQKLAEIERDLRYFSAKLESAQLVDPAQQPRHLVLFGAKVTIEDETGEQSVFQIVGEDEADIAQRKVSYVSPVAKALLGRKVGDNTIWQRPAGPIALDILNIDY
ncbi:GreA/GreB family elongation factor [Methylophilus medardicus]|uniref:Transcription elongation factor GreAB n=1 Tax=Methylophilus medardicus TaxID=2588534 RepID=A0A5B8CSV6_9PROT|nr:GreA/GreB family elongation factor [Methylophilus medardicus]QDC43965.1 transcription elongation factor GreAB [Methylophilus medardicus]QDC48972.1 transcription elongation factor GreAB [Methylophilus medardicus]QDC52677.1 transcription elongation factor GreAB [Methylophilus medardicus]